MSKGVKCKQGGTVAALVCSGLQMISNKAANGSYENDSWKKVSCIASFSFPEYRKCMGVKNLQDIGIILTIYFDK